MIFLSIFFACSPSGAAFDACAARYQAECDCGKDPTSSCGVAKNLDRLATSCGSFDLRKCDSKSDYWNALECEAVHSSITLWEDQFKRDQECYVKTLRQFCPGVGADEETWLEVDSEIAACYETVDSGE